MKEYKTFLIEKAIEEFKDNGLQYRTLPNGHFQVMGVNFWATSEKIYDPKTNFKGVGLSTFISYILEVKQNEH